MHPKKILFLTLRTFSITGGIEKVNRIFCKALQDLSESKIEAHSHSMYDNNAEIDTKYTSKTAFKGFSKRKIKFAYQSIVLGKQANVVVLSHINLLLFAWMIKKISPKTRIILLAHGIEVWRNLSVWKKAFLQKNAEIWAVSKFTSNVLQEKHHIPSANIRVLNNCLDPHLKLPVSFNKPTALLDKYELEKNQPIIFTLTRISSFEKYKGYDLVIEAVAELKKTYPNIQYLIAGKADCDEKERLLKLIHQLGLANNVKLLGYLSDQELTDHFLLADVFIMPSKKEGFGIVFIEAAACGCKVIAGNQDGSTDALLNGQLGQLINPTSKTEIKTALLNALNQPRELTQAKEIQATCLNAFGYKGYVEKVKDLISD